jgi:hypothetical protein
MRHTLLLAAAAAIAGCGGATHTVTETRTQPAATPPAGSTAATPTTTSAASPGCTDAACAVRIVAARGFTANPTFDPSRNLNVLLGVRTGSADGTAQQAFFFWHGRYIGTDTKDISAGIRIASQADDTATLVYRLYNPQDPQCCSTAGEATVRYRYNGSRLVPLDPIPPGSSTERSSRR